MARPEGRWHDVVGPRENFKAENDVTTPVWTRLLQLEIVWVRLVRIVGVVQGDDVETNLVLLGPLELDQEVAVSIDSKLVASKYGHYQV